jgi:hypothetical protein
VLGVPAAPDVFPREPIEEFGVDREITLAAELFAAADNADAEDRFPESVDLDTGGEGILWTD